MCSSRSRTLLSSAISAIGIAAVSAGFVSTPRAHAQSVGSLLGKAKDKAKQKVQEAHDNQASSSGSGTATAAQTAPAQGDARASQETGTSAPPRRAMSKKDGQLHDLPADPSASELSPLAMEKNLVAALRKLAPKHTLVLLVSCEQTTDGAKPEFAYKTAYLTVGGGTFQSGSLSAVPPSVQAQFAALREYNLKEHEGHHAWDACKVTVPFGPVDVIGVQTMGEPYRVVYGFKKVGAEYGDVEEAYQMPTPEALRTTALATLKQKVRDEKAAIAQEEKAVREGSFASGDSGSSPSNTTNNGSGSTTGGGTESVAAAGSTYKCTKCGTVATTKSGQPPAKGCPKGGGLHHWVKQ